MRIGDLIVFYFFDPNGAWALLAVLEFCYAHGLVITSDSITSTFLALLQGSAAL